MNAKKIFVSGVTGFQGAAIARLLLERGFNVSSLVRNLKSDTIDSRVEAIPGEFENVNEVSSALRNVNGAVFTLPLIFDKDKAISITKNFIEAAKKENVPLVVFNSGFDLPKEKANLLGVDIKVILKKEFDESGLNVITISPDIYLDNLTAPWSIPLIIEKGILPYPIKEGQKVPWISHTDLAKYITAAIEKPELAGRTLFVGGNLLAGEQIAQEISAKINKPVHFVSLSPDEFEQNLSPSFGAIAAKEISNLYRFLDLNIDRILAKDYKASQEILDVTPQSLSEWVENIRWNY
ncbi:NmrA family NAD(P)-binding protein [Aquimarina sp. D1M17]|uniref:SDR family oxidoreductase n=1 Tax=Aquimarina acroporae TaxID=2937283 RepID=UPI0020BD5F06|nr:NmrA family NAD(P)-binding protein [Aquimarina acroporae]MCK8523480.1 NmrA family NAD(P)-binding protein [Aquimarina acroporae]